jgi:hypothetical protein
MSSNDIHTCSYYCTRPACIAAQRDELREQFIAKDHEVAGFVNELRDVAKEYAHTQQLRERIAFVVHRFLGRTP